MRRQPMTIAELAQAVSNLSLEARMVRAELCATRGDHRLADVAVGTDFPTYARSRVQYCEDCLLILIDGQPQNPLSTPDPDAGARAPGD